MAVALEVAHRADRPVDGDLVEVGPAQPDELGVDVGEQAALQQRIGREVDAGHDVAGMEGDLLGLGEEIDRVLVQHHAADRRERNDLLGDDLGRIEDVEVELVGRRLVEGLDVERPFGEVAVVDRLPQIAPRVVGIGAGDLHRLVPQGRGRADAGPPMELHEGRFVPGIDQAEGVDAEALDVAQRARDGAIRHRPHQHVHALGHQRDEVPESVVRRGRLREAAVRLHLHGMDKVGELHRILDEEHRDVVADQVEIALVGIELHGEAAHVARRVDRARAARHRREAREDLGPLARVLQERGLGQARQVLDRLEVAMRARAAGMDDALGNALVVEMGDLLAQDEILEQRRPARAALQRILVVGDRRALVGGERIVGGGGGLVEFAAGRRGGWCGLTSWAFSRNDPLARRPAAQPVAFQGVKQSK